MRRRGVRATSAVAGVLAAGTLAALAPTGAAAQRANENVVTSAEDAFGAAIGNERIGIYSDQDVRGFNPVRAGNVRIDGIYFDQVAALNSRTRTGTAIRVGSAALDFRFPAPTGIVDFHLRHAGDRRVLSVAGGPIPYGGTNLEFDAQVPIVKDRLGIAFGAARVEEHYVDGEGVQFRVLGIVPRLRFERGEIFPIFSAFTAREQGARPVITAPGAFLPPFPATAREIGQSWTQNENDNATLGVISRFRLDDRWSVRGGVFDSWTNRLHNFSEVFIVDSPDGRGSHRVIADPEQTTRSLSGEVQLVWNRPEGPIAHNLIFMLRGRDRTNETGGSVVTDLGPVRLDQPDPELEPAFRFGPVDSARIRQLTVAAGYVGQRAGLGKINLGLQKVDYQASVDIPGRAVPSTRDTPWLYNGAVVLGPRKGIALYASYVKGLEDSGLAPENAANRNEQLPASLTTQVDGGVRIARGRHRLVVSAFSITKPYFSFDGANRFADLGEVRHRGVEASLSAKLLGDRLDLLAGAVLMDPVVTGEARQSGRVGERPVGTARTLWRVDADYRTPIDGLSFSGAVVHNGPRTASTRAYAELGGRQVETPAVTTLDLGARYRFTVHDTPMSVRVLANNVLDAESWKVLASNSYQRNEGRRFTFILIADF